MMADLTQVEKELVMVNMLSSNNSSRRKKAISKLRKWIRDTAELGLSEVHYERIWTGLFYYYWMSDKPLVQEACAERTSKLIDFLNTSDAAMNFVNGFFSMMSKKFDSVSCHRIDKFLMLVRRFLRRCLFWLKDRRWDEQLVTDFGHQIYHAEQILPVSLSMHLNDIFNEEVAKVSGGGITTKQLIALLNGYIQCMVKLKPNMKIVNDIQRRIFSQLFRQLKFYVKAKLESISEGFPSTDGRGHQANSNGHDANDEEVIAANGEVSTTTPLDPRPGHVDVILPILDFDENEFIKVLDEPCNDPLVAQKAKNIIRQLKNQLKSIASLRKRYSDKESTIASFPILQKKQPAVNVVGPSTSLQLQNNVVLCPSDAVLSDDDDDDHDRINEPVATEEIVNAADNGDVPAGSENDDTNRTYRVKNQIEEAEIPPIILTNDSEHWKPVLAETLSQLVVNTMMVEKPPVQPSVSGVVTSRKRLNSAVDMMGDKKQKVVFALANNSMHGFDEYKKTMKSNPTIPYDSEKLPGKSVLKQSAIITPVNPFRGFKRSSIMRRNLHK